MICRRVLLYTGPAVIDPAELPAIIDLKLRKRWFRELADVVKLIAIFDLNESFLQRLPTERHAKFLELLEEKRLDEEWHLRED